MKTTIDLPDDLLVEVKIEAARQHKKLKELVPDLIRAGLKARRTPPAAGSRAMARWLEEWVEMGEAARRALRLTGPSFVVLESVCALARRVGDPRIAREAGAKMAAHPALHLEPMTEALLQEAERLGVDLRLRGADALYAATAVRLGCPLLSWDQELIARGGARLPSDWLSTSRQQTK